MCKEEKAALRKELLARRRAIGESEREALDAALIGHIAAHRYFLNADAILGFYPVRGEPDLTPLYRMAMARGVPVYLPRITEGEMTFYRYLEGEVLVSDEVRVPSPAPKGDTAKPTAETLCILPGLSADKGGVRLGYGGGFYDRFLPRFAGKVIFPLYSALLVEHLPAEPTDCPVACIITEKGESLHV